MDVWCVGPPTVDDVKTSNKGLNGGEAAFFDIATEIDIEKADEAKPRMDFSKRKRPVGDKPSFRDTFRRENRPSTRWLEVASSHNAPTHEALPSCRERWWKAWRM